MRRSSSLTTPTLKRPLKVIFQLLVELESCSFTPLYAGAILCKFRGSGQTCVCANRIYVQSSVYADFASRLAEKVAAFKVGNGLDSTTYVRSCSQTHDAWYTMMTARVTGHTVRSFTTVPSPKSSDTSTTLLRSVPASSSGATLPTPNLKTLARSTLPPSSLTFPRLRYSRTKKRLVRSQP